MCCCIFNSTGVAALDATFARHGTWTTSTRQHAIAAYLITYLVRRHARVKLRPNFVGPQRISSSTELALRLDFVVALQNLVDLVPRQQG